MRLRTRAVGALGAVLALAAAAACTGDAAGGGAGEAAEGQPFEEHRLVDMVNESNRLLYELETAEGRIIQNCLEAENFTVHDQLWFSISEPEESEALFGADDWGNWLPPLDEAAEYGLGVWAISDEGRDSDAAEAYREHQGYESEGLRSSDGEPGAGYDSVDNSAFEALSPQEQYDWAVAYFGAATASQEYGHLVGVDTSGSGDDSAGAEGEIGLSDDFQYVQPEPGGCQREMIDALYDDLRLVEDPEGQEYRSANWAYRPVNPMDDFAKYEEFDVLFRERTAAVEGALVDCLAERGHPGWEFGEDGSSLPTTDYFYELYHGPGSVVGDYPDLPKDAPTDYEGKKAFEIAFAVELAECGDETGFRETVRQAWADTQQEYYVSIETSVYSWQEEVRGLLTKAQEALEG